MKRYHYEEWMQVSVPEGESLIGFSVIYLLSPGSVNGLGLVTVLEN